MTQSHPPDDVPSAASHEVKKLRGEFASHWAAGEHPRIETYLARAPATAQATLLAELLFLEVVYRRHQGEQPTREEYGARFANDPQLIDAVFDRADSSPSGDEAVAAASTMGEASEETDDFRTLAHDTSPDGATENYPPASEHPTQDYTASQNDTSQSNTASGIHDHPTIDNPGPHDSTQNFTGKEAPPKKPRNLPVIPNYDVIEILGQGGMGVVVAARDQKLDRLVAIKLPRNEGFATDEQRERFLREARSAARLRHPNICPIYEVGELDQRPFITMGFIQGHTLSGWAKQTKPSARRIAEKVALLARAVGYAHERGVVHRDLKPSNVMVDSETEEPVLMDFGLAKELHEENSHLTQSGQIMGTPAYMSPEQAQGDQDSIGRPTDVYALGAILYDLLCGRPPFVGNVGDVLRRVQTEDPPTPRSLMPKVHRDLETICLKALAKRPSARYESAVALADDLDRFSSGEPILARRESIVSQAGRKLRRNPALVVAALVVLVAIPLVAYLAAGRSDAQHITRILSEFNNGLDAAEWPETHLQKMELILTDLEALSPQRAARQRTRLHARFAEHIDQTMIRAAKVDTAAVQQAIALLQKRDASSAAQLQKQLSERLRNWDVVWDLQPPFDNLATVMRQETVQPVDSRGMLLRPKGDFLVARTSCQGNTECEARFHKNWANAPQVGLFMHTTAQPTPQRGYLFVLTSLSPEEEQERGKPAEPMRDILQAGGQVTQKIYRNGTLLGARMVKLSPGRPIRMRARRQGVRFEFQVNQLPPLAFDDLLAVGAARGGLFAVSLPNGTALQQMTVRQQSLPAQASPLEQGDDLYSRNQFSAALAEYQEQATTSGQSDFGQEARLKQSLCLRKLNRHDEADQALQQLAAEPGDRWPLLANCELWSRCIQQQRGAEAFEIFDALATRWSSAQVEGIVPAHLYVYLAFHCKKQATGYRLVMYNPQRIDFLKQADRVEAYFQQDTLTRNHTRWALFRALFAADHLDEALAVVDDMLAQSPRPTANNQWWWFPLYDERCWILRLQQNAARGLADLDAKLFTKDRTYATDMLPLLVERARLHAALGQFALAEKDVLAFLEHAQSQTVDARYTTHASLVLGFLRERRGDLAGARKAWKDGLPDEPFAEGTFKNGGLKAFHEGMLATLSGELSEADVGRLKEHFLPTGKKTNNVLLSSAIQIALPEATPARLVKAGRSVWERPANREIARQIAMRELSLTETIRLTLITATAHGANHIGFGDELTPEEQELLYQTAAQGYTAYIGGQLGKRHALQFLMTWKGTTSFLGWAGIAPSLKPALRGPLAYFFALRLLRLNQPQDAMTLFRTAAKDAPADSLLSRLAQKRLARANKPTQKKTPARSPQPARQP